MPADAESGARAPAAVERFVKQLVITLKAVLLYPPASSIPRENAQEGVELLGKVLRDSAEARFGITKDSIIFDGLPVYPGQTAFKSFAREMYNRSLAEMRFHAGASADDIVRFLGILKTPAVDLAEAGGFENRLWDLGVDSITVRETSSRVVDMGALDPVSDASGMGEEWPPPKERIDEILAAAFSGRPRDQRMLVRVLEDPKAISRYLTESIHTRGLTVEQGIQSMKLNEMAHMAAQQTPEKRPVIFRALAQAVEDLDEETRRKLIHEKMLPDARTDEAVASILRQMDVDEISRLLVEGLADDDISVDGLARAIRNLALISLADRDEVLNSAGASMREAGLSEQVIGDVLENAAPSKLVIADQRSHIAGPTGAEEDSTADSILKMIDMAPSSVDERFEDDPEFIELQEESRRGLSDGDVARALVTLASVDAQGDHFDRLMKEIEDTIGLLIEQGEYEVAADAAEALAAAQSAPGLVEERLARVRQALIGLGDIESMKSVTKAMRMYRAGTPEHSACKRLLDALGQIAIDPLLEVLADEPNMSARKALVDIVSEMAGKHIDELSSRVTDGRWYVVRNVVAILGRTKSSAILPSLGRTLRHSDARVRRETIRALAGIHDRLADEMLIAGLEDSDGQNVQLAARYLGTTGSRGSVGALERVAKGEGRGNRDLGPRVEAIEAIGRIGSAESVSLLESLAGKRSLIGSKGVRELRSAAQSALVALKAREDGRSGGNA